MPTDDVEKQKQLLIEAFDAARREGDVNNAGLIWEALAELESEG